jgi:hypothetical protein
MLTSQNGVAVRATNGTTVDLFAVSTTSTDLSFADVKATGKAALARTKDNSVSMAILARGTSLSTGSNLLISSDKAINCAWRKKADGAAIKAEAPYKAQGATTALQIGGLQPGTNYSTAINGKASSAVAANAQGIALLSVDLSSRAQIVLSTGNTSQNSTMMHANSAAGLSVVKHHNGLAFEILLPETQAFTLEVFDFRGRKVWSYNETGFAQTRHNIIWPCSSAQSGKAAYIARLIAHDNFKVAYYTIKTCVVY